MPFFWADQEWQTHRCSNEVTSFSGTRRRTLGSLGGLCWRCAAAEYVILQQSEGRFWLKLCGKDGSDWSLLQEMICQNRYQVVNRVESNWAASRLIRRFIWQQLVITYPRYCSSTKYSGLDALSPDPRGPSFFLEAEVSFKLAVASNVSRLDSNPRNGGVWSAWSLLAKITWLIRVIYGKIIVHLKEMRISWGILPYSRRTLPHPPYLTYLGPYITV